MKIGSTEDGGRMPVEKNPPVAVKTEPGEDWTKDLGWKGLERRVATGSQKRVQLLQ
jgi:hypothetical protein